MLALALCQSAAKGGGGGAGAAEFMFGAKAASVNLSNGAKTATATAASTFVTAFDTPPVNTSRTYALALSTVNGGPGAGNASADPETYLSDTADSFILTATGDLRVNDASIGGTGVTFTSGDVIRMQFNATQVRFSKNGGGYTAFFTHGVTGTLRVGASLFTSGETATGSYE